MLNTYLDDVEMKEDTRTHLYLAQIAQVIAQANSEKSKKWTLRDFLIKYIEPIKKGAKQTKAAMSASKMAWGAFLGKKVDDGSDDS